MKEYNGKKHYTVDELLEKYRREGGSGYRPNRTFGFICNTLAIITVATMVYFITY